jgi:hypothetical protein
MTGLNYCGVFFNHFKGPGKYMHHALKGLKAAWFSHLVNVRAVYDSDIQL